MKIKRTKPGYKKKVLPSRMMQMTKMGFSKPAICKIRANGLSETHRYLPLEVEVLREQITAMILEDLELISKHTMIWVEEIKRQGLAQNYIDTCNRIVISLANPTAPTKQPII